MKENTTGDHVSAQKLGFENCPAMLISFRYRRCDSDVISRSGDIDASNSIAEPVVLDQLSGCLICL